MAKSSGQKLKLLYLIKMLRENTDENHPMSTPDIIKYLENQGIHAAVSYTHLTLPTT